MARDFWYAECAPCKWQEKHETQDEAIAAAEDHVFLKHRNVHSTTRAAERMGLVQNRTENAFATQMPLLDQAQAPDVTPAAAEVKTEQALSPAPQKTE